MTDSHTSDGPGVKTPSELKYYDLYENAPNAYFSINATDGRILNANAAAARLLGYDRETLVGMRAFDLYGDTPNGLPKAKEVFGRFIGGESIRDVELQMRRKNGENVWISLSVEPITDAEGVVVESRSMVIDISERKAYQKKLKSLSSKLLLAEEEERRRIASELHDRIGQNLAIMKLVLRNLREAVSPSEPGELGELGTLLDQIIHDTRTLTFEISPPILYKLGLRAAVEWLADTIRERHGLDIEFEDDGLSEPEDDDLRFLIFRTVRELLYNVVKHARADSVKIEFKTEADRMTITVEDDGAGFEMPLIGTYGNGDPGFGLFSVRERLENSGGKLLIDTEKGCGTTITAISPLSVK